MAFRTKASAVTEAGCSAMLASLALNTLPEHKHKDKFKKIKNARISITTVG
ncbi:hypothetical protein GCM10008090_24480 [Arenicella chitinivorans]|uniref:Uncharacterized protein n=1 Tax=Arenicella chitinivorans TaxID=1329800 RepID=A0A918VP40_9GAMM|nr:hypothetical protein GCM10008090_24480 [Arenicella chitinivorans]